MKLSKSARIRKIAFFSGLFVICLLPVMACQEEASDSITGSLDKALEAISQERASISIVGRALSKKELVRLDKLARASDFIEKAKKELVSDDNSSRMESSKVKGEKPDDN